MITQKQFEAELIAAGFTLSEARSVIEEADRQEAKVIFNMLPLVFDRPDRVVRILRSEPPAERRDCDEMPLGVPRG